MCRSFYGNMRIVGVGMFIHTFRNILTLFDLEGRKEIMGCSEWGSLVTLQGMGTVMNIMVTVNCFDRGTALFSFIFASMTYLGLVEAYRGIESIAQASNWMLVVFCVCTFYIFILI